jgi:hypothetical protein
MYMRAFVCKTYFVKNSMQICGFEESSIGTHIRRAHTPRTVHTHVYVRSGVCVSEYIYIYIYIYIHIYIYVHTHTQCVCVG